MAAIAVAVTGVTSACSPLRVGETALARDADGTLSAVIFTCGEEYDRVRLFDVTGTETMTEVGGWERRWNFDEAASVSLLHPSGGWTAFRDWDGHVRRGRLYQMEADGDGLDSLATRPIVFDSADLVELEPGDVLRSGKDWTATPLRQSMDDFRSSVCD